MSLKDDLIQALKERGRPAAAALDVYDKEPLPPDHPLRTLPNVTMTPHLGFVTNSAFSGFLDGVIGHLNSLLPEDRGLVADC